jgi:hypothetical protein
MMGNILPLVRALDMIVKRLYFFKTTIGNSLIHIIFAFILIGKRRLAGISKPVVNEGVFFHRKVRVGDLYHSFSDGGCI